jgi:hypothetical protein
MKTKESWRRSAVPEVVRTAIQRATQNDAAFALACRLFLEDAEDEDLADTVDAARLEHAVARATLDAWTHGLGSPDDVGVAYAAVGERILRDEEKRLRPRGCS